jgi:putative protease
MGVASLKIEGRMKSAEYVYGATRIYRELIDRHRNASEKENESLKKIFSRGGFTDAYFVGNPQANDMLGVRSESNKEDSRSIAAAPTDAVKVPIKARAVFKKDEPISLTLYNHNKTVTVCGDMPSVAINAPITKEALLTRLCKMGNTLLSVRVEDIDISLEEGLMVPVSQINDLRRRAAEAFESADRDEAPVYEKTKLSPKYKENFTSAVFYCPEKSGVIDGFDAKIVPLYLYGEYKDSANGVYLPPVIYDSEIEKIKGQLDKAKALGARYALITNLSHIPLISGYGFIAIADFRLNVYNSYTRQLLNDFGIDKIICQPELTLPMVRDIGGGMIVLGRIPLMLTERCFIKDNFGCQNCNNAFLKDRTGAEFPIIREYDHRNQILNSAYTYMGDRKDEIKRAGITHLHFIFANETPKTASILYKAYKSAAAFPFASIRYRRIGKR